MFKEPVHQILRKIKNEPYFKWTNKMGGDPMKRNQNLYCQYHQDRGHTTEDYRTLRDYLGQLVKLEKLNQFLYHSTGHGNQDRPTYQKDVSSSPPLGTISVILVALGQTGSCPSKVMSIVWPHADDLIPDLKCGKMEIQPSISFSDENKVGTFQPHNDALMVTL